MTTIVAGELSRSFDPAVSEWGNPPDFIGNPPLLAGRWERLELKHLSRGRKRNQRDSVSKRRAKAEQSKPIHVSHMEILNIKFLISNKS